MSSKKVTELCRFAFGSLLTPKANPYGKVQYDAGVVLTEKDSQSIFEAIEEALENYRGGPRGKDLPPNDKLNMPWRQSTKKNDAGEKEEVPGEFLWVFKRPHTWKTKSGEEQRNTPPLIYDSMGRIVQDITEIPGGSTGKVIYEVGIYNNMGNSGVTLRLIGFQVAELAEMGGLELQPIEGGTFVAEAEDAVADMNSLLRG